MSEILTINTDDGVIRQDNIEPYKVFDDSILVKNFVVPELAVDYSKYITLAKRLRMTLKLYGALGLAAPQCGINIRMFVLSVGDKFITCINPKILSASKETVKEKEMCLSYVGLSIPIYRHESIDVEYYDELGKKYEVTFTGLTSRIFQHEIDHLNGVRMIDHVGPATLMLAKKKQLKIMKQYNKNVKNNPNLFRS